MSEKTKVLELIDLVQPSWTPPAPLDDGSLLEQGLLFVLSRTLTESQAAQTVRALRGAYADWNELRISQVQEFREHIKTKSEDVALRAGNDARAYLQEIFQENHGFDIQFLSQDPTAASKFLSELEFLGGAAGHLLLSIANGGELPVTQGIVRVLDRVGIVARTGSLKKTKERLEPLIPKERVADFALRLGDVAERLCDPKKPICWECPLVVTCKHGKKVLKDWLAQQKRLELHKKKEEKRLEILRKKDDVRRKKEEERARLKAEAEAQKQAREKEKRRKTEERERAKRERENARKKAIEEKKQQAERAKQEAAKKKAAEAKKKAKAAARKPEPKKKPAGKPATKKGAAPKPASKKKPAARKPSPKSAPPKRKTTKRKR